MVPFSFQATPYAEVNAVLYEVLSGVQNILRDRFVGMYLYGSLAVGDFQPDRSDIDFLVVTEEELPGQVVAALQAMHIRMAERDQPLGREIEGSYIPRHALRRYDPANARHPHIDRGGGLAVEQHDCDWVVQRYVLREHGVVVAGPAIHTLIDPITPDKLKQAVLELMHIWWAPMVDEPSQLQESSYRTYAILTMCRVLYTMQHGTIVSKPVAAHWALDSQGERWAPLISHALDGVHNESREHVEETREWIRYTWKRCQAMHGR